jgi:RNA polymerase sigma-70 factor, ECF subfamily
VDLYPFDDRYMERLRRRDRETQNHFAGYFGGLLRAKLRTRRVSEHVISDLQQETFLRVLDAIRTGEVRQPDRLGAYVNSVCNHVLLEYFRDVAREQHDDVDSVDVPDNGADLEARMITDEETQSVRATMDRLSERERAVLRGILLERDKDEMCRELDVDRGYLRVLTHRAMGTFRELINENKGPNGFLPARRKKLNNR